MDVLRKKIKKSNEVVIDIKKNGIVAETAVNIAADSFAQPSSSPSSPLSSTGGSFFEKISLSIFYLVLLMLPVFVIPFGVSPFFSSKNIVLSMGVLSVSFFWLLLRIQGGAVKIPKSFLLFSSFLIILAWLVSSLFSGHIQLSIVGKIYESDTFSIIASAVLMMFFASVLLNTRRRISKFYGLLFSSAFAVFVFQIANIAFKFNLPFLGDIFKFRNSNLLGGWGDFSIFFGFMALTAIILSQSGGFSKRNKIILNMVIVFSLIAMVISGTFFSWLIFGIFASAIWTFGFMASSPKKFFSVPFAVLVISLFFVWDGSNIAGSNGAGRFLGNGGRVSGAISGVLGTAFTEVRPSWAATGILVKNSLSEKPVLGSGPNTFAYNWMKFKPSAVNSTLFWNARFYSGAGHIPSALVTTGVLGTMALILFLASFLWYGKKVFTKNENAAGGNEFLTASFAGASFLWLCEMFYTPGTVILSLAFVSSGIVVAVLSQQGRIGAMDLSLSKKTKFSLANTIITLFLLIGSVSLIYMYARKVSAFRSYDKALKTFNSTGDIDGAEKALTKAQKTDSQDEYLRTLSELNLIKLNKTLTDPSLSKDSAVKSVEESAALAAQYASQAKDLNPVDPANWMQLGKIYESMIPLKLENADSFALSAYSQAFESSPKDPSPALASARVALQMNKSEDAKKYLNFSLGIKNNFVPALFLLSQIEAQSGNFKEAILRAEQAASFSPNEPGIFFQLGLLYYQNNDTDLARQAFERAVSLESNYANARYFLGIVYDKMGMKKEALEQFENIAAANPDNEEVAQILSNLKNGEKALKNISPPGKPPEKRSEPPVSDDENVQLKKAKKK